MLMLARNAMTHLLRMKRLTVCAAILAFVHGCTSTAPSTPPDAKTPLLSGTRWTAMVVENDFTAGRRPTIQFREDGRTVGTTGCTIYSASANIADSTLRILDLRLEPEDSRPTSCDSLHSVQQARFLGALQSTRLVRKQSEKLLLLDARQKLLVLLERREDPQASSGRSVSEVGEFARSVFDMGDVDPLHGAYSANGPLKEMQFAAVTPALGQYFGVDAGVLVARAPADNPFELREGDVILSVNGRQPANGPHAFHILKSYPAGTTLDLRVFRQRELLNLRVTLSE